MLTSEQIGSLNQLLGFALESLDIPPELQARATAVYEALGQWIIEHDAQAGRREPEFFPQGSAALGTATMDEDWDIDGVYQRQIARASITQELLKSQAGEVLHGFQANQRRLGEPVPRIVEEDRCWRLVYPGFHVDALPAIPDDLDDKRSTRLLIADKDPDQREWILTDPKGYIKWFIEQMGELYETERDRIAKASYRAIEQVPVWEVKTILQRTVQFVRRHRDLFYGDDRELRPASMLITTLVARSYDSEPTIPEALQAIVEGMPNHLHLKDGELWVPNPTNDEENLARHMVGDSRRTAKFHLWLRKLNADILGTSVAKGIQLNELIAKSIGERPAIAAPKRLAKVREEMRESGKLRMAAGTATLGAVGAVAVPRHTFHGDHRS